MAWKQTAGCLFLQPCSQHRTFRQKPKAITIIIIITMVYFALQPVSWINTLVSLQYKIVQNCPAKSTVSHNDVWYGRNDLGNFSVRVNRELIKRKDAKYCVNKPATCCSLHRHGCGLAWQRRQRHLVSRTRGGLDDLRLNTTNSTANCECNSKKTGTGICRVHCGKVISLAPEGLSKFHFQPVTSVF